MHIFVQVNYKTKIQIKMKLTIKAKNKLNNDNAAKAELCVAFNASYDTVQRWIRNNQEDSKLTTVKAIEIIEAKTGMKQSDILV